jgi:RNA polymerase-binding transcription factor DksA
MQSNLSPRDFEVLQHELLERKTQLHLATAAEAGAATNEAQLERDLHELREVDSALERIEAGTYGFCLRCGKPMDPARLQLFPAARFDICCMENEETEHERQHAPAGEPPAAPRSLPS